MAPWRVEGVEAGFHQRANRGENGENVPSFFFLRGPKLDGFNIVKYGLIWFNVWFNIRLNMVWYGLKMDLKYRNTRSI